MQILERFTVQDPQNLWKRYLIGIALLTALLIGGHAANLQKLRMGVLDAETINVSGRQRMLSQRMALLSTSLHATGDTEKYGDLLREALATFRSSHLDLLERSEIVPAANALYRVGSEEGLDAHVQIFSASVEQFLTLPRDHPDSEQVLARIEDMAIYPLLAELNSVVGAFEGDARARYTIIERIQTVTFALSIIILLIEGLLIFWPAQISVNQALRRVEDKSYLLKERNIQLQALSEKMEHSAFHDQLTGLANRKKLYLDLERRLSDRRINASELCVMHIDLDRFKEINDTLGHFVGDAVLQRAAEAMQSILRKDDLVARVGGDEFVVVAMVSEERSGASAQQIAEKLIARIKTPTVIAGNTCTVGASIGYVFAEGSEDHPEHLIADADIALYEAKRAGKGVAIRFKREMRSGIERRHLLTQDLDRAIDLGEFVPFFQPKVALSDGRLLGFEVLARWEHPIRGTLPPSDFIDLAEETGKLAVIELQIILKSVDALVAMRHEGLNVPTLALNASGSSLRRTGYAADLKKALAMRHLSNRDIVIEIVETTLIKDAEDKALNTLRSLSADGFGIEIDDFGTGYASLSMLSTLKLSGLKIDRSLIADLENPRSCQVIEAVIGLGKSMGLHILAEGVEHANQFAALKRFGCDAIQGFAIGQPMSFNDAILWVEEYGKRPDIAVGSTSSVRQLT